MKAKVANYRGSHHTQNPKQMILAVDGVESREDASKLVGKIVTWTTKSGKKLEGKVSAPHGDKGKVRAIFEKGLPGQALGTEINIS